MAAFRALRTMCDRRLGRLPLYEDITPSKGWTDGPNGRNLIFDIPGFNKEEVNMEIDESGNVNIKGRHDAGNNRFRRFSITVKAPENTNMKGIVGNLQEGLYTVVFPKMAVTKAVLEAGMGGGNGEAAEWTKPDHKQLDADELDRKTDKGLEAALGTEASKTTEKAIAESSTGSAVDKIETAKKVLETATQEPETMTKPLETAADQETETVSKPPETAAKEPEAVREPQGTILTKTLVTDIPVAEKATKTLNEIATQEPETVTKILETAADQEQQTASKPTETAANQEQRTVSKPPETAVQEPEKVTKSIKTAYLVLETSAMTSENATTTMNNPSALPETNNLSDIPDDATEPLAQNTVKTVLQTEMDKYAIKDEAKELQGIKKDGGFLENVIEMITEHKACIISAILAFSMGILISRRINS